MLWLAPPLPCLCGPCHQIDAVEGQKLLLPAKAVNAERASVVVGAKRGDEPVVAAGRFARSIIENVVDFSRSATGEASEAGDEIVVSPLLFCLACGLRLDACVGNPPLIAAGFIPLGSEGRAPEHQASGLP
jgi:hypothetical protein